MQIEIDLRIESLKYELDEERERLFSKLSEIKENFKK
jgi:hypothetical protein